MTYERSLLVEDENPDGRKPDFTCQFEDGCVVVEAVSPVINAHFKEEHKRQSALTEIIEKNMPPERLITTIELPDINLSDSKKEFKQAIVRMLASELPNEGEEPKGFVEKISRGTIHLLVEPRKKGSQSQVLGPGYGGCCDAEQRIEYVVHRKRKQLRHSKYPALLAVEVSDTSYILEAFDSVLYGRSYERYNEYRQLTGTGFDPSGLFLKNVAEAGKEPTFAGVLAFSNVGFGYCLPPVLYLHPRFLGKLPENILRLSTRYYNEETQSICHRPSQIPNLMQGLFSVDKAE